MMPNAKESALKKIERNLFKDRKDIKENFSEREFQRKARIMLCVSKKLDQPMISDKELVEFLKAGCEGACTPVENATAYRDIAAVSKICGNVTLASKAWYRYMIVEGAKEAFEIAKKQKDAKGMAAALDKIGKYTMADKEDSENILSQMLPPNFEPTADASVLGEEIIVIGNPEKRRRQLRDLFKGKDIVDIQSTDITDEERL